jgi:hypothetical protein
MIFERRWVRKYLENPFSDIRIVPRVESPYFLADMTEI